MIDRRPRLANRTLSYLSTLLGVLLLARPATGQIPAETPAATTPKAPAVPPRKTLELHRALLPITIDGCPRRAGLAEAAGPRAALRVLPRRQRRRRPCAPSASSPTTPTSLYIAFRAYDPSPAEIRAHLADRDAITTFQQDDHVGFQLDPFNDERRAFQFRINPLGVQADADLQRAGRHRRLRLGRDLEERRAASTERRLRGRGRDPVQPAPLPAVANGASPGASTPSAPTRAASATGSPRATRTATAAASSARSNKITGFAGITPGKQPRARPDADRPPHRPPCRLPRRPARRRTTRRPTPA